MRSAPVLVVSSDPDTQDMYIYAIRIKRRPVYGTASLQETVALAREVRPGAIVVDVRRSRDWQLCLRLARHSATKEIPVVVVTGFVAPDARYRRLAAQLGCAAFMAKPSLPDAVVDTIGRVISGERGIEEITPHDSSR